MPQTVERRTAPRTSTRIPVELMLRSSPAPLPAQAVDVGTSGICVSTASRFPLCELSSVSFAIGGERAKIPAEARWQRFDNSGRGLVAGLMFLDVETRLAAALRSHVYEAALKIASFLLEKTELSGLHVDDAIDAALLTRAADYSVGRRIYQQGELRSRGDSVFIVEKGSVVLEAQAPGTGRLVLDTIGQGGIFAGLPLLAEAPHTESAIAATEVSLVEIDPYNFASLEITRPRVARGLTRAILRRRALTTRLHFLEGA